MSDDAINHAAKVAADSISFRSQLGTLGPDPYKTLMRDMDDEGLLVTPEHDRAVAAKALRDMRDEMSRWEGWDSRDIGHAFLSESVLDTLDDAADRLAQQGHEQEGRR